MLAEELSEFAEDIKFDGYKIANRSAISNAAKRIFASGGFSAYQLTALITSAITKSLFLHSLSITTSAVLTRGATVLAGPIGWVLMGGITAIDISGPDYRVTVPAVFQIVLLRKKFILINKNNLCKEIQREFDINDL